MLDIDLFAQGLNFVFGQADVTGRKAVISLYRLRQEFYGLPTMKMFSGNAFSRRRFTSWATHTGWGTVRTPPV